LTSVTVILCTYNRCESLARALKSVAATKMPESVEWEVVVVDNNSTDGTRGVIEGFCNENSGRFRYLLERKQGLSHARNAGICEARGNIVAFTDDDVVVEPNWLENLTTILQSGEWAGSGGRVIPDQNFSCPNWMSPEERYGLGPLSIFDLGLVSKNLDEPPFGASMAFRKEIFQKYGGFRTDLGRSPGSLMSNEDTEFGSRLLEAGERLRYEPSAVLYHCIPQDRIQKQYFLRWWFNKARSDLRQAGGPNGDWSIAGVPALLIPKLGVSTLRWMLTIGPRKRFLKKIAVWSRAGEIRECYRHPFRAKGQLGGGNDTK
jgi:glucosyl-dolichyl phosphate glucuronosyltransferase